MPGPARSKSFFTPYSAPTKKTVKRTPTFNAPTSNTSTTDTSDAQSPNYEAIMIPGEEEGSISTSEEEEDSISTPEEQVDYDSMTIDELEKMEPVKEELLKSKPFDTGNHKRTMDRHRKRMEKKLHSEEEKRRMEALIHDTKFKSSNFRDVIPDHEPLYAYAQRVGHHKWAIAARIEYVRQGFVLFMNTAQILNYQKEGGTSSETGGMEDDRDGEGAATESTSNEIPPTRKFPPAAFMKRRASMMEEVRSSATPSTPPVLSSEPATSSPPVLSTASALALAAAKPPPQVLPPQPSNPPVLSSEPATSSPPVLSTASALALAAAKPPPQVLPPQPSNPPASDPGVSPASTAPPEPLTVRQKLPDRPSVLTRLLATFNRLLGRTEHMTPPPLHTLEHTYSFSNGHIPLDPEEGLIPIAIDCFATGLVIKHCAEGTRRNMKIYTATTANHSLGRYRAENNRLIPQKELKTIPGALTNVLWGIIPRTSMVCASGLGILVIYGSRSKPLIEMYANDGTIQGYFRVADGYPEVVSWRDFYSLNWYYEMDEAPPKKIRKLN